jgi:hypothetical protein
MNTFALEYLSDLGRHSLLGRESTRVRAALSVVLSALPEHVQQRLAQEDGAAVRFVYCPDLSVTWFLREAIPAGTQFVVISPDAGELAAKPLAAVIAHELGHAWYRIEHRSSTDSGIPGEKQADALAKAWGFGKDLVEHLKADLGDPGTDNKLAEQLRERISALE